MTFSLTRKNENPFSKDGSSFIRPSISQLVKFVQLGLYPVDCECRNRLNFFGGPEITTTYSGRNIFARGTTLELRYQENWLYQISSTLISSVIRLSLIPRYDNSKLRISISHIHTPHSLKDKIGLFICSLVF